MMKLPRPCKNAPGRIEPWNDFSARYPSRKPPAAVVVKMIVPESRVRFPARSTCRLPNKIAPDIARCLHGGGSTRLIALCTYGKRSAGDAERELLLIASQNGFVPIAARSIVCEHAFSAKIAHGRPNAADLAQLASFGADTARRIAQGSVSPVPFDADTPLAPYYTPLKENGTSAHFLKAKPVTDASRCTRCGICASVCPMGSIAADEPDSTAGICIKCQACIKACPARARRFLDGDFLSHVKMLENTLGD